MINKDITVWITGASSGIGFALAEQLLAAGACCILTARNLTNLQTLQQTYPKHCHLLPYDITDETAIEDTRLQLQAISAKLDWVILNAGTCEYLDVAQFDLSLIKRVLNTNIIGTMHCLDIALPLLKQTLQAKIAIVSSAVVYLPFPRAEAYGASKAALDYFADSLRLDVKPYGMQVSVIRPGFVKTPLTDKNEFGMPFIVTSQQAAKAIIKGLSKGKTIIHFPWPLILGLRILRLLPKSWQRMVATYLGKQR